jgi:transposase-like protein
MKNYDKIFKQRALELYNETKSYAAVTEAFKISKGTLHKWIREGIRPSGKLGNKNAQKLDEEAFCEYVVLIVKQNDVRIVELSA